MAGSSDAKPCKRCKAEDAPWKLRSAPTCSKCYSNYIETKSAKRLGFLHKETRTSSLPEPRRYAAGLSFGPSSSAMVHIVDQHTRHLHASKKLSSAFEVLFVHVDTELAHHGDTTDTPAQRRLANYRNQFSHVQFDCVHLNEVLGVKTVDWSTLPGLGNSGDPSERLRNMFGRLPSVTAKADVLRLLIRHLLLHVAMERSYKALLLGHSTTALAALTLSEVANGRGFSVPWQVNDGPYTICTYHPHSGGKPVSQTEFPVHYPLREIFQGEINDYVSLTPSLAGLDLGRSLEEGSVVSHKDTSIEEVMVRYFQNVEEPYAGIVANVVRTTGKLDRVRSDVLCGLCGVTLDEQGDSKWAGEIGDDCDSSRGGQHHGGKLCYGCKRSVNG